MKNELEKLLKAIGDSYEDRSAGCSTPPQMVEDFRAGLGYSVGSKYIKITTGDGGSVWGFVMAVIDDKFNEGDILKAASWGSPARNFARGNVYGDYRVRWMGA